MWRFAQFILVAVGFYLLGCAPESGREAPDTTAAVDTAARLDAADRPVTAGPTDPAEQPGAEAFERDVDQFFPDPDALRATYPLLSQGMLTILAEDAERNVGVYARSIDNAVAIVAVNRSDEAHSLRVELPERLQHTYETAVTTQPEGFRVQQDATALLLELPERFGLVLTN